MLSSTSTKYPKLRLVKLLTIPDKKLARNLAGLDLVDWSVIALRVLGIPTFI